MKYIPFGSAITPKDMMTLVSSQYKIQNEMTFASITYIRDIDTPLDLADSEDKLTVREWLLRENTPNGKKVFN